MIGGDMLHRNDMSCTEIEDTVEDLIREIAAARWAFENLGEQLDDQQQRWMLEAERLLVEGHISIAECLKSVVHQLAALRIRVAKGSSEEEAER
jgi:hypothetical protein